MEEDQTEPEEEEMEPEEDEITCEDLPQTPSQPLSLTPETPDTLFNILFSNYTNSQKTNLLSAWAEKQSHTPPTTGSGLSKAALRKRKYIANMTQEQRENYRSRHTKLMRSIRENVNDQIKERTRHQDNLRKRHVRETHYSHIYSHHSANSDIQCSGSSNIRHDIEGNNFIYVPN